MVYSIWNRFQTVYFNKISNIKSLLWSITFYSGDTKSKIEYDIKNKGSYPENFRPIGATFGARC
jgi:hypothetical protein